MINHRFERRRQPYHVRRVGITVIGPKDNTRIRPYLLVTQGGKNTQDERDEGLKVIAQKFKHKNFARTCTDGQSSVLLAIKTPES